jgi:hypothetical protein
MARLTSICFIMGSMNNLDLERLVLRAVDQILSGRRIEDSRIEGKSAWPEPTKARQLAGHANSARGEEIIWIIGIDEETHRLTNPEMPDIAIWWSQIAARFADDVVPEIRDLNVQVNDDASVTALLFVTDRAPYLVKSGDGGARAEREVPIRVGTRTRSAYRHELLRLLHPAAIPPPATLLSASLSAVQGQAGVRPDGPELFLGGLAQASAPSPGQTSPPVMVNLYMDLYIDQGPDETVVFPYHLSKCLIAGFRQRSDESPIESLSFDLSHNFKSMRAKEGGIESRDGCLAIRGGAVLSFSGMQTVERIDPARYETIRVFRLGVTLGIAGGERSIKIIENLARTTRHPTRSARPIGTWVFPRGGPVS